MSIKEEINDFEFESLSTVDSDIIKNGFLDFTTDLESSDAVDIWVENSNILGDLVDNYEEEPLTLKEVLEMLIPFKEVVSRDVRLIFEAKNIDQVFSYYQENAFLVSIIDVMYKNIDESFDYESFFSELVDLSDIIVDSLDS